MLAIALLALALLPGSASLPGMEPTYAFPTPVLTE